MYVECRLHELLRACNVEQLLCPVHHTSWLFWPSTASHHATPADDEQTTGGYYNFSNIRFAEPPTGQNRFRRPQPPAQNRDVVQDGSQGRICPASSPSWFTFNRQWITSYLEGEGFNGTMQQLNAINSTIPERAADPRTNEDCLFLDVMVPEKIYGLKDIARNFTPAPVLVWIYGKHCRVRS